MHLPRPTRTAALAAALLLPGCAERLAGPDDPTPVPPLTAQERHVASANTAFALALLRDLHAAEEAPNVLVSPLSASMSLGMALNGAREETWEAMRRTLGFEGLGEEEINEAYRGLVDKLRALDPDVEFELANAVWHERTFAVAGEFLGRAERYFDATVAPIDVLDPASPGVINRWVEERTGGRIRDLIGQIDPLDRLFLVNAVYFKAPWSLPFEPLATGPRPFTRGDRSQVQAPTMMQDGPFRSFRGDDVHAVELLYADSAYSMVLAVPAPGRTLDAVVAELTPERWQEWMARFEASRVMLRVPRFRFEYAVPLQEPLTRMGMGIAFRPFEADFQRIAPVDDLHVSRVKHKTFIDVHELGTEAAAATATVVSVTSMPPEIVFDRPFLVAIRERDSRTILFIGRIGDPTAG